MNPFFVPYPKASLSLFLKVSFVIAVTIIFTLTVFQPFGTDSFQHPNKYWILSGYGIVVFLSNALYYLVTKWILKDSIIDRWSIMNEFIFISGCLLMSLIFCYFYWTQIFHVPHSTTQFVAFIKMAFSVALIPVSVYFAFLYNTYKDVRFAEKIEINKSNRPEDIELKSSSGTEIIKVTYQNLLCVKSNDNYVIVYSLEDGKSTRQMIRNTMKNVEDQLDDLKVLRCHRSYLINTSKIVGMKGNVTNSKLTLDGLNEPIPVSRSKVEAVRKLIVNH